MSPQTINTKLKWNSNLVCKVGAKEVNVITLIEGAKGFVVVEGFAGVHVVTSVVNEEGPLDGSPTRNIMPPIGDLRPTVVSNRLRLKSLRLGETSIFCFENSAG